MEQYRILHRMIRECFKNATENNKIIQLKIRERCKEPTFLPPLPNKFIQQIQHVFVECLGLGARKIRRVKMKRL